MVVHSKGYSLVFKASSQYAVEKIRSILESKLNTKLKPLLGIIEPYMQSQEKLGVTFSQIFFCIGTRLHPLRYENHTFFDPLSYIDIKKPFK